MQTTKELRHPYVIRKKGVQGGRAIISGTRIPISTIIIWYKAGKEVHEILDMYPQLSPSQVHDALSYYYDYREEIEKEIAIIQDEIHLQKRYPPGKGTVRTVKS